MTSSSPFYFKRSVSKSLGLVAFAGLCAAGLLSGCTGSSDDGTVVGTGGVLAAGGTVGAGGLVGTGGTPATGGIAAVGGVSNTGGVTAAGGVLVTGGTSSGGAAAGGALAAGGADAAGGAGTGGSEVGIGGSGTGGAGGNEFQPCPAAEPCKILPLGDSITEGLIANQNTFNGGYRVQLFTRAVEDGHDITFVGTRNNGPDTVAGKPFPKKHEGTSGIKIQALADKANKYGEGPHIVLLHIGTNDMSSDSAAAPARLEAFIDQITTEVPDALLVVASLIPFPLSSNNTNNYNAIIEPLVDEKAAAGKHVIFVDMNKEYPAGGGTTPDSVHPDTPGYAIMGDVWYDAIASYLP